jgi:hypothetical protein
MRVMRNMRGAFLEPLSEKTVMQKVKNVLGIESEPK